MLESRVKHAGRAINWLITGPERQCPLCDGAVHSEISRRMQHQLNLTTVVCENCSFVFTNPLPAREVYEKFYVEAYASYYGHIAAKPEGPRLQKEPTAVTERFQEIEKHSVLPGRRLLEVGPGNGLFLYWARRRGFDVLAVEPSPEFCTVLKKMGVACIEGNLNQVDASSVGKFDVIVMSHVLEHFYSPSEALSMVWALLRENGLLVVEVPNILKPFRSLDSYFLRYVHPSNFSPQTLRLMLNAHGFNVRWMDEAGSDWRSPQSLAVVAERTDVRRNLSACGSGSANEVKRAIKRYRKFWRTKGWIMWTLWQSYRAARSATYRAFRMLRTRISG